MQGMPEMFDKGAGATKVTVDTSVPSLQAHRLLLRQLVAKRHGELDNSK
jgi:hypothetical protein